jgi:uncharacterized membrane protein YfcA
MRIVSIPIATLYFDREIYKADAKENKRRMAGAGQDFIPSFILILIMTFFVQKPTRIAIGSNLAIVLPTSLAGFLGNAVSGQIEWLLTVPILFATTPATLLGSMASRPFSFVYLKRVLAVLIAIVAVRIWLSVLRF